MGKRGPKQEPEHLKLLKGRPTNEAAPRPKPVADPRPDYLGEIARQTWDKFAPQLEQAGLLTERDGLEFRNLCIVEEIIQRTYESIAARTSYVMTTESGYKQQIPEVGILHNAIMQMHRLSDRFGLDPISRQSLLSPKGKESGKKLKSLLSK